jgi:putative transposase
MSLPRAVVPGRVYMITRRCSERRFFLRPSRQGNNAFIYCLAVAAEKYGVQVIFTVAMSNHHHTGIVDVHGNLPDFLAHFHKLVAKHQNALHGRWESMWASCQTSAVELVDPQDILAKMVYAFVNPVADHIVEKVHHWPGVSSLAHTISDKPLTATRPKKFFRSDGNMPEQVSLSLHLPDTLMGSSRADVITRLTERVAAAEKTAAAERSESGHTVIGRGVVRRQPWSDSPQTREPRRQLSPRVACRDVWRRIETLARNKAWLGAYRKARCLFISGEIGIGESGSTVFPAGTFWLRRFAGVVCEPFASS